MTDQPDGVTIDEEANTVTVSRRYRAPVERAWLAWTDAELIARWWGPNGWTTTVYEMDVRPGGRWRFAMAPDDGSAEPVRVLAHYTDVVRQQTLCYRDTFADARWRPDGTDEFATVVTFSPTATGSSVVLRAEFGDLAALRRAVELGMVDGYRETLARLAGELETS